MPNAFEAWSTRIAGSTPALLQWAQQQSAAGHSPQALAASMRQTGWAEPVVQGVLHWLTQAPPATTAATAAAPSAPTDTQPALPGPNLQGNPLELDAGDRRVQVLMSMQHPRIVLLGNVLSPQECAQIIADARPAMARSRTVATHSDHEEINPDRTSDGMFFQRGETPTVALLEARLAKLLQWPLENGEGLQVLNYRPGAEYKPHHDYFDPKEPSSAAILRRGGQRLGTLVIYLNDTPAGGCTYFPETQLRIHPRQGNAVFFSYAQPQPHTLTLHGGDPVEQGEKWIATKWLRTHAFH